MTGPNCERTALADPLSGEASTHDSRNEWSGSSKSASALVSSMNEPKLTMNGTRCNASATFHDAGDMKTGFTSSISRTLGAASSMSLRGRVATGLSWARNDTPPG
jgi:hypothetical protein